MATSSSARVAAAAAARPPPPPPAYAYPPSAGASAAATAGPHHLQNAAGPRPPPAPQFFIDQKRGELYELRQVLRALPTERDISKQREALKKLIAYMTVGLDVSRLFADVVMLASTSDLVQKKMIYQYLINYADTNPSLSLLAINTFQKDCNDEDPRLRGLAIRSLCSLRLSCMLEYIDPAARKGLQDRSPYVRRAAIMGLLKVHKLLQEVMATDEEGARQRMEDVRQRLYEALFDEDPQVAINAIYALNEVEAEEGGLVVTRQIATRFLNRIKRFSEWGVCAVLNLIATYVPESEEEIFDIMNILDDKLKSSSAAVVLGCAKCFLQLTKNNEDLRRQVYHRLRAPLLTLVGPAYGETAYTVLQHILLIIETGGTDAVDVFEGEARQFFCRYSDPSYMKATKLRILVSIAVERNAPELVREIQEYVCDADTDIARQSIGSLGMIACRLPSSLEEVITLLLSFVEMEVADYLVAAICIVFRDLLRKFPHVISRVAEAVRTLALRLTDGGDGFAAILWILGEFAEHIEGTPYILERAVDRFVEEPASVRLELLTATVKCFFKFPGETQPTLGRLFEQAINDSSNPDVHDKALFYYRFLKTSLQDAKKILATPLPPVEDVESPAERQLSQQLLQEFNTLSVVYRQPSCVFLCEKPIPFGGRPPHSSSRSQHDTGSSSSICGSNSASSLAAAASTSVPRRRGGPEDRRENEAAASMWGNSYRPSAAAAAASSPPLLISDAVEEAGGGGEEDEEEDEEEEEEEGDEAPAAAPAAAATAAATAAVATAAAVGLFEEQQRQPNATQRQNKTDENILISTEQQSEEGRGKGEGSSRAATAAAGDGWGKAGGRRQEAAGGDLLFHFDPRGAGEGQQHPDTDKDDAVKGNFLGPLLEGRPSRQQQQQRGAPAASPLRLLPSASLDSTEFQTWWEGLEGSSSTFCCSHKMTAAAAEVLAHVGCSSAAADTLGSDLEAATAARKIFTMASGVVENTLKMFFYAKDVDGVLYLCEMQLRLQQQLEDELRITVKSVYPQEKEVDGGVSVFDAADPRQQQQLHASRRQTFAEEVHQAVVDQLLLQ